MTAAAVGIAAAALLLGGIAELVTRLLRRHGQLLLRIEQLERELAAARGGVAEPALIALDGRHTTLTELRAPGIPLLLVFTDPACGPCTGLMPELGAWQREHAGSLRTVLISRGAPETNLEHARRHGVTDVLLQDGLELDERFGVVGTPSAVLIAADGTAVSAVHAGADQIRALVARHVAATSPAVLAA